MDHRNQCCNLITRGLCLFAEFQCFRVNWESVTQCHCSAICQNDKCHLFTFYSTHFSIRGIAFCNDSWLSSSWIVDCAWRLVRFCLTTSASDDSHFRRISFKNGFSHCFLVQFCLLHTLIQLDLQWPLQAPFRPPPLHLKRKTCSGLFYSKKAMGINKTFQLTEKECKIISKLNQNQNYSLPIQVWQSTIICHNNTCGFTVWIRKESIIWNWTRYKIRLIIITSLKTYNSRENSFMRICIIISIGMYNNAYGNREIYRSRNFCRCP